MAQGFSVLCSNHLSYINKNKLIVYYLSFQITIKLASQPNGPFNSGSNSTIENNEKDETRNLIMDGVVFILKLTFM